MYPVAENYTGELNLQLSITDSSRVIFTGRLQFVEQSSRCSVVQLDHSLIEFTDSFSN